MNRPDAEPKSLPSMIGRLVSRLLGLAGVRIIRSSTHDRLLADLRRIATELENDSRRREEAEDALRSTLARITGVEQALNRGLLESEDRERDLIRLFLDREAAQHQTKLSIVTDAPVAFSSADHVHPRGTKNDNTRHPRFPVACERVFGRKVSHLDLGCAGGGLVWDFVLTGHQSVGVEGSDYNLLNQRAEWRTLPDSLFTADITRPFHFVSPSGERFRFDVITAWEVLEHISQDALPRLFANVRDNLAEGGIFVASVATFPDEDPETCAKWHLTVQGRDDWVRCLAAEGFEVEEGLFSVADFVRGSGNPRADDWNALTQPEMGFHAVCRLRPPRQRAPSNRDPDTRTGDRGINAGG